jgi:type III pantothenate kinase
MLLAIDIGNTKISFGVFKGNKIIRRFDIPTKYYNLKELKKDLQKCEIEDSIICSVVPESTPILEKDLMKFLGRIPYIIGKDIRVPVKNLYRKPAQVGQDRLVNAFAGIRLYGAPLIVVDFGTAITFDVISKNAEYLGGMILPGLSMSLESLSEKTALLPKIKLSKPKEFIGRDTKNSLLSGIVYGFACLSDGMIKKIKKRLGKNTKVIGTGGDILLMKRYCRLIDKIDMNLTLKGLNYIFINRGL